MKYPPAPRRCITIAHMALKTTKSRASLKAALTDHGMAVVDDLATETADIAIVDLRPEAISPRTIEQAIQSAWQQPRAHPTLFLVAPEAFRTPPIARLAKTDRVVPFTTPARPLLTAVRQLVHDAARAEEAALRLSALSSLGLGAQTADTAFTPDTTLFLADPAPEALEAFGALAAHKSTRAALSRAQTLHALEMGQADALVLMVQKNRRSLAGLVRLLRRHTDLSSLPIIALEKKPTSRHSTYWASVGADAVLSPQDPMMVAALCRRGARARAAGQSLDTLLKQSVVTDLGEVSRLASTRYFETCLAHRRELAKGPFALGAIRLHPDGNANHQAALSEAGVYIAMATRTLDMVTRPAPDLFLIALPNTDKVSAEASMRTYARLVQDLKFGDIDHPITFDASTHVLVGSPGDDPATLITTLLADLPQEPASFMDLEDA